MELTVNSAWERVCSVLSWLEVWWRVSRLPGPPPVSLLTGHSPVLTDKGLFKVLLGWEREYRDCHKFYMALHPLVFIYSPEVVQVVLSRKQEHNDKGNFYHALLPLLGDGLICTKGEKWFAHRRMLTPTFHFNILENYFETFKSQTASYILELSQSSLLTDFGDICPYTRKLTLNIICETVMGSFLESEKNEEEEIIKSMNKLEALGLQRMLKPWLLIDEIYQKTELYSQQEKYRQILYQATSKLIQRRKSQIRQRISEDNVEVKKNKEIFLDQLILQQLSGGALSDDDIRDEVSTFMFAGHNTTQLAINYCIYLLGQNKDCQEKAVEEQDEIFGDSEREPSLKDLQRMTYLERCIKETLRLYPSVPFLARRLTHDIHLGKHILPKGVDCVLPVYVTQRIPEQFPNPEQFDPDNFLPERIQERHPYSYFPFSAGPRNCIGKKFAMIAEKTILSSLLRKFKIDSLIKPEDLNLVPVIILIPKGGLKVKLTARNLHKMDTKNTEGLMINSLQNSYHLTRTC